MMTRTLTEDPSGGLHIPPELFEELLRPGCEFEVEVDEERNVLVVRPVRTAPHDDSWADDPEVRARILRGSAQIQAGKGKRLTEEQLLALFE
jgi:antitoxin component of MazEF toxin-antitoxin module